MAEYCDQFIQNQRTHSADCFSKPRRYSSSLQEEKLTSHHVTLAVLCRFKGCWQITLGDGLPLVAQEVKVSRLKMQEDLVQSLGWEDSGRMN